MRGMLAGVVLLLLLAGCTSGTGSKSGGLPRSALAGQGSIDAVVVDPQNSRIVYALQSSSLLKSVDGGASWRSIDFPRTSVNAFAFDPPGNLYVAGTSTVFVAFRSSDGGSHWRKLSSPFQSPVNTFVVAPSNRRVIYAGLSGGGGSNVFKSADGGASWRPCGLPGWRTIDTLAVDPQNPQTVYAVHQGNPFQSHVFKTTNGGRSWHELGTRSLAGEAVQTITPDPQRPRILYAAAMDGVFKSTDAGTHWQIDGLREQEMFVNQVVVDPRNPRRLYAAIVEGGVLQSADAGRDWHRRGLPNENVDVLAISSDGRVLYAGTDDDGVVVFPVRRQ